MQRLSSCVFTHGLLQQLGDALGLLLPSIPSKALVRRVFYHASLYALQSHDYGFHHGMLRYEGVQSGASLGKLNSSPSRVMRVSKPGLHASRLWHTIILGLKGQSPVTSPNIEK
ncbi:hypothetical protein OH492_08425 [Vibrio chagasii]|nr:hypothetical protein [Vibrio chagasii]